MGPRSQIRRSLVMELTLVAIVSHDYIPRRWTLRCGQFFKCGAVHKTRRQLRKRNRHLSRFFPWCWVRTAIIVVVPTVAIRPISFTSDWGLLAVYRVLEKYLRRYRLDSFKLVDGFVLVSLFVISVLLMPQFRRLQGALVHQGVDLLQSLQIICDGNSFFN